MYPRMYGDQGWYAYEPAPYSEGALAVYYWSMDPADRERRRRTAWLDYLDGRDPDYPVRALQRRFRRDSLQGGRAASPTRLRPTPDWPTIR